MCIRCSFPRAVGVAGAREPLGHAHPEGHPGPRQVPHFLTPGEHLDAWRRSGTSARVYAEQHGLNPSSLYSWRRAAPRTPPRILRVVLTPSATCEIILPVGRTLRFQEAIATDTLRAILRAMEPA